MRRYFGPMQRAFGALDAAGQEKIERDLLDLIRGLNRPGEKTMGVPSDYRRSLPPAADVGERRAAARR